MKTVKMSEEILALGNCVMPQDEGYSNGSVTCRLATMDEFFEADNETTGEVCFLSDDGLLLMECIQNNTAIVPMIRRNGLTPLWETTIAKKICEGTTERRNKPYNAHVIVKAHGKLKGDWQNDCAWFR